MIYRKGRCEMKPTVRDIAKKAEVSIASVSMVLNNKPSRITEATRQRILDAAEALGYNFEEKQNRVKEQLRTVDSIIGVLCPKYNNEFIDACLCGINRYAYMHGYRVITCDIDDSTEKALEYLNVISRIGVGGIIMIPPMDMNQNSNNVLLGKALHETKKPFLLLDEAIDRVFCDFITADNKDGAYMATEYLIHKGHQNIGMIVGNREVYTCRKRIEGYKEALAFNGISIIDENIYYGNFRWQSGYDGMKYFDKLGVKAIFAYSDEIALGVYRYAQEHHYTIGEDISVVGFNDSTMASTLLPALTSVNQPGQLMGKKACEVLLKRITGVDKEAVKTTYFSPRLIERASVKTLIS